MRKILDSINDTKKGTRKLLEKDKKRNREDTRF